jgi:hypothetical protein
LELRGVEKIDLNVALDEYKELYPFNLNTGNCALFTHFVTKIGRANHHIILANVHLFYNPYHEVIKYG